MRPDYGSVVPWVEPRVGRGARHVGPGCVPAQHAAAARGGRRSVGAAFDVVEGARERFTLSWHLSYEEAPPVEDADSALARTEAWWREWSGRWRYEGAYRDEVLTSLIALKAMTSETTGARDRGADDVAPGGPRRRAQLGLPLLLAARLGARARGAPGRRLHRRGGRLPRLPAAGRHGRSGEHPDHVRHRRRAAADRVRADDLPGYEGSRPVRVGNAASEQFQLDVYGEVAGVISIAAGMLGQGRSSPAGRGGGRSSNTSRRSGASRTTASGRRAARSGTTRTRR